MTYVSNDLTHKTENSGRLKFFCCCFFFVLFFLFFLVVFWGFFPDKSVLAKNHLLLKYSGDFTSLEIHTCIIFLTGLVGFKFPSQVNIEVMLCQSVYLTTLFPGQA